MSRFSDERSLVSCERGGGVLWLIVFTATLGLYMKLGYPNLAKTNQTIADSFALILFTANLFCLCSIIAVWIQGGKSIRRAQRDIKKRVKEIETLVDQSQAKLLQYESRLPSNRLSLTQKGMEDLGRVRKITSALQTRYNAVGELIASGSDIDTIDAYEVLESNLSAGDNCFDTVIGGDREEFDIPVNQIEAVLRELFGSIEHEAQERADEIKQETELVA